MEDIIDNQDIDEIVLENAQDSPTEPVQPQKPGLTAIVDYSLGYVCSYLSPEDATNADFWPIMEANGVSFEGVPMGFEEEPPQPVTFEISTAAAAEQERQGARDAQHIQLLDDTQASAQGMDAATESAAAHCIGRLSTDADEPAQSIPLPPSNANVLEEEISEGFNRVHEYSTLPRNKK